MGMEKMELVFITEGMRKGDIKKAQELNKTIFADTEFLKAEDVSTACKVVARHVNQAYEVVMGKYEALKANLENQFNSLMSERELTDEELEIVDGGGFFSWIKRNWKKVVVGAALAVVGVACVVSGVGLVAAGAAAAAAAAGPAAALVAASSASVAGIAGWTAIGVGVVAGAAGAGQLISAAKS